LSHCAGRFFHLRGDRHHVERALGHQALAGVADGLAAVVVEVGFQHGDGFGEPRAGWLRLAGGVFRGCRAIS
jgi:hypothetical protein